MSCSQGSQSSSEGPKLQRRLLNPTLESVEHPARGVINPINMLTSYD